MNYIVNKKTGECLVGTSDWDAPIVVNCEEMLSSQDQYFPVQFDGTNLKVQIPGQMLYVTVEFYEIFVSGKYHTDEDGNVYFDTIWQNNPAPQHWSRNSDAIFQSGVDSGDFCLALNNNECWYNAVCILGCNPLDLSQQWEIVEN